MGDQQQYIYRIRPTRLAMLTDGPSDAEAAAVAEHFAYLQALQRQGTVILAGRTQTADEHSFGIIIFRAHSDEEAQALVRNDPAVRKGVMAAELFPYRISLYSIPPDL